MRPSAQAHNGRLAWSGFSSSLVKSLFFPSLPSTTSRASKQAFSYALSLQCRDEKNLETEFTFATVLVEVLRQCHRLLFIFHNLKSLGHWQGHRDAEIFDTLRRQREISNMIKKKKKTAPCRWSSAFWNVAPCRLRQIHMFLGKIITKRTFIPRTGKQNNWGPTSQQIGRGNEKRQSDSGRIGEGGTGKRNRKRDDAAYHGRWPSRASWVKPLRRNKRARRRGAERGNIEAGARKEEAARSTVDGHFVAIGRAPVLLTSVWALKIKLSCHHR